MTDWPEHATPNVKCPCCGKPNDRSSPNDPADGAPPKTGDVTMCIGCGSLALYTEDGSLRLPTMVEMAELVAMPNVQRVLHAWETAFGGLKQ